MSRGAPVLPTILFILLIGHRGASQEGYSSRSYNIYEDRFPAFRSNRYSSSQPKLKSTEGTTKKPVKYSYEQFNNPYKNYDVPLQRFPVRPNRRLQGRRIPPTRNPQPPPSIYYDHEFVATTTAQPRYQFQPTHQLLPRPQSQPQPRPRPQTQPQPRPQPQSQPPSEYEYNYYQTRGRRPGKGRRRRGRRRFGGRRGRRRRLRGRRRFRTTTTTTTTTTQPPDYYDDDYYYYLDDDYYDEKPSTTTTKRPSERRFKIRPVSIRPTLKPKSSTTTTTLSPNYKHRKDGRIIDYNADPNFPFELKGADLTDYPFLISMPTYIEFECKGRLNGYYANVDLGCQVYHHCAEGTRYDHLCANYTIFDQVTYTCRFVNKVDCKKSEVNYKKNARIYDGIFSDVDYNYEKQRPNRNESSEVTWRHVALKPRFAIEIYGKNSTLVKDRDEDHNENKHKEEMEIIK